MTAPVEKTVTLPLSPEDAFRLFTDGIDRWWPKDSHSTSAGDGAAARAVTVEPEVGGRILETRHDGAVSEWGRIRDWVPGDRVRFSWHPGRTADEATEVDVRFTADAIGCRVDVTHTGFAVLGAGAAEVQASYAKGWPMVLACLARAAGLVTA